MNTPSLTDSPESNKPKVVITADYQRWREFIFALTPERVGVSKNEADRVYGVMMDIGMVDRQHGVNWAISLSALTGGEVSFMPTPGGGLFGLGNDPKVAQVAQEIIKIGQILWRETNPTEDFSLPEPGFVQFFFLTTGGVRVFKGHLNQLQTPENPFIKLLNRFGFIRDFADQWAEQRASASRR